MTIHQAFQEWLESFFRPNGGLIASGHGAKARYEWRLSADAGTTSQRNGSLFRRQPEAEGGQRQQAFPKRIFAESHGNTQNH
jgi:hypothetical protein